MHVITRRTILDFCKLHTEAYGVMNSWYRAVKKARWEKFADVRAMYGSADGVGNCTVFNVGGNKYRIVARVHYARTRDDGQETEGKIFLLHVLTHAEYDENRWASSCV